MSILYASQADLERLLSSRGVQSFADHDQDGTSDPDVIDDCLVQASQEIELYCKRYEPADLANSPLVNRWATVLAVVFLCQRRGNGVPESLAEEFKRIYELLMQIGSGIFELPGIAASADSVPKFSNMTVDRLAGNRQLRTIPVPGAHDPKIVSQEKSYDNGGP